MGRGFLSLGLLFCVGGLLAEPKMDLYDFANAVPADLVEHREASTSWEGKGRFRVRLEPKGMWPGITLKAPDGKWDVSDYDKVSVQLRNIGKGMINVGFRFDNPGANGSQHCLQEFIMLEAGERRVLTMKINRKSTPTVKLFGMRGYPAEIGGSTGAGKTVEPDNIICFLLFGHAPKEAMEFEVERVWVHGEFAGKKLMQEFTEENFFPFIDTFGQFIHRDWPGKLHGAKDFPARIQEEAADLAKYPGPEGWNKWGGWAAGPSFEATGFFRTLKHEGKWWLVDPDGKLFFSHGIDCVGLEGTTPLDDRDHWFQDFPGKLPEFQDCFAKQWHVVNGYYKGKQPKLFNFARANLRRKYGETWQETAANLAHKRLRSWGMNTIGNWSDRFIWGMKKTPYFVTFGSRAKILEGSTGYWGKFADVFDPSFAEGIRKSMEGQRGVTVDDPWCIGYFVNNELSWGDDKSLALASLQSPPEQAAKIEFVRQLRNKYVEIGKLNAVWGTEHASWDALLATREAPDPEKAAEDLRAFYAAFADRYFRVIKEEIKAVAPNQLYAGCRFAWVNPVVAAMSARHCDIVSYNLYRRDVANFKLPDGLDAPVIIGEFHFGALDRGMFHTGLVATESQEDRANHYKAYVESVLANPTFVGCHWFKYMDEPTTGRGLDEENYQIGFLDIVDTPYPETIAASREVGYGMYEFRFGKKQGK